MWWYMTIIPALGRYKLDVQHKFEENLGYVVSSRQSWLHRETLLKKKRRKEKTKKDKKRK